MVVYVIDETGTTSHMKQALFDAFERLKIRHGSTPNVRVAVIKQGTTAGSPLTAKDEQLVGNPVHDFTTVQGLAVEQIEKRLNLRMDDEQFYIGIREAQRMIESKCPAGVDLTAKPWCQRKVILTLGDGEIGIVPGSYFGADRETDMPENLFNGLAGAGIKVNTLCLKGICGHHQVLCAATDPMVFINMYPSQRRHIADAECKNNHGVPAKKIFHTLSKDFLKGVSKRTGGEYFGYLR